MKKKTKHKKNTKKQCATHPISEQERIAKILENGPNSKGPSPRLRYDTNLKKITASEIEDKTIDRIIITDSLIS